MARGPLPDPQRRRRNAPTIATVTLPASGRPGPPPRPPAGRALGKAGKAWWKWAWSTPQATQWVGALYVVATRAQHEDALAAIKDDPRALVAALKAITELDEQLGLAPKALAQLRWTIVPDAPVAAAVPGGVSTVPSRARALRAV